MSIILVMLALAFFGWCCFDAGYDVAWWKAHRERDKGKP